VTSAVSVSRDKLITILKFALADVVGVIAFELALELRHRIKLLSTRRLAG